MNQKPIENTLFIGNGFSRAVFRDRPSWSDLFEGVSSSIKDYTILYEAFLLEKKQKGQTEDAVKNELIEKIRTTFSGKSIKDNINDLKHFGGDLIQHHVNNILTTNYDNGIEFILCKFCGYREQTPKDMALENIYNIRTYKLFVNDDTGHEVKLWKIHGDLNRLRSITLGFDQYCGALSKLSEYVKGTYKSSKKDVKVECAGPTDIKCKEQKFDQLSWAELFFRTNVYIVGFGLSSSEIDIWWLLNRRARLMIDIPQIRNTITYLYDVEFETPFQTSKDGKEKEKKAMFAALDAFQVTYSPIKSDSGYISNIFKSMPETGQIA